MNNKLVFDSTLFNVTPPKVTSLRKAPSSIGMNLAD